MKKMILIISVGLISSCAQRQSSYPHHWWMTFPKDEAYSWEILPQSVKKSENKVILSKRNELGLLSNFANTPFILDGVYYESLEGLWQMMKYPENENDLRFKRAPHKWRLTRDEVRKLSGLEAWRAGHEATKILEELKIDWISYQGNKVYYRSQDIEKHYEIIYRASLAKVEQNEQVKKILLQTRGLELLPDHHQGPRGTKSWRYFKIYMDIRDKLSN